MRIISFIQDGHSIRKILNHITADTCKRSGGPFARKAAAKPPIIAPARGPPETEFKYDHSYEFA